MDPASPGGKLRVLQLNSARRHIGEAAHTLNLTQALRRAGHGVWLGLREGHLTFELAQTWKLHPIPFHMPHRWWPPQDLADMRRLARLVREHKIQVIHVHRGKDHWLAAAAVRLFSLNLPIIRTRHVVTPLRNNVANRWLARRTRRLVAVSQAVAADVQSSGLYPAERVRVILGGIDLALFEARGARAATRERWGLPARALVVLCVARFAAVKGHRILLAAWQAAVRGRREAFLVLAGDGALQREVEAQARKLGVAESVRFLGHQHPQDIPALLEAADIGVLASLGSEGFSRAVLEYMAAGLPVVATRVGAIPDLVEDGLTGRLVSPGDPAALGAALRALLAAPAAERAALGRAGRKRAQARHSLEAWASAHEQLYREVLAEAQAEAEGKA